MKKKLFSILMAVAMLATFMPSMAFATSNAKAGAAVKVMVVTAKKSGTKAVKLSWTKVAGAKSYVVKSGSKKVTVSKKTNYTVKKIGKKKVKKNQKLTLSVQACSDAKGKKVIKGVLTNKATYKVGAKNAKVTANKQMQVMVGETASMKAKGAKFYYSDNTAAKVAGGNVTGITEGTANVYAVAADGTNVKCAVTVIPANFTVTFDMNGSTKTAPVTQTIKKGEKATMPEAPAYQDTTKGFVRWTEDKEGTKPFDFENTAITKDITLYAQWEDAVKLILNDENGTKIEDIYVGKSAKYKDALANKLPKDVAPNGTTAGKKYVGWSTTKGGTAVSDTATVVAGNLYALTKATYLVTFKDGTTTVGTPQVVVTGEKYTLPSDPTTAGYFYDGWSTVLGDGTKKVTSPSAVTSAITLYALKTPAYKDATGAEYGEVEYLQNDEAGGFINTGVVVTSKLDCELDQQVLDAPNSEARQGTYGNSKNRFELPCANGNSNTWMFGLGTEFKSCGINVVPDLLERHQWKLSAADKKLYHMTNGQWTSVSEFTNTPEDNAAGFVLLFGRSIERTPDIPSDTTYLSKTRIWSCKFIDDGKTIRNLVPVKKTSKAEYGLFDKVTNTFYGNAGTGSFSGGAYAYVK